MSLLQIYQWVCQWKNFENRLTLGEVMGKSLVSCFFETQCIYENHVYWENAVSPTLQVINPTVNGIYTAWNPGMSFFCSHWLPRDYRCSTIRKGAMLLRLTVKDNSISATLNELLSLPINTPWSPSAAGVGLIPRRQQTTHAPITRRLSLMTCYAWNNVPPRFCTSWNKRCENK